jgi:hypothetical protein
MLPRWDSMGEEDVQTFMLEIGMEYIPAANIC